MVTFIIVVSVVLAFGLGAWRGAPYVPILRRPSIELLDLAELRPGETLIDLGSGDGRLLKLAASRGIRAIGYEINPWLYLISLINCYPHRDLVEIHLADYWRVKLPPADVISVFLIQRYMARLDAKLTKELTRPTVLVSYVFFLPDRKPSQTTKNAFRYDYKIGKIS
jgi:hypothetical protein